MTKDNRYTSGQVIRSSGLWTFLQRGGTQVIGFVLGIFLTRNLLPEDFGLLAMVVIFTGFARVLQDFGFGTALLQHKAPDDSHYSSVFWFNMLVGVFLAVLLGGAAPLLVQFYEEPDLLWVARVMALEFVFSALVSVQSIQLKKQFRFKLVSLVDLVATLLYYGIAIPMAVKGWGVWALVVGSLTRVLVRTIGLWGFSGWVPSLSMQKDRLGELFRFGMYATGNSIMGYLNRNLDNLLIGKLASSVALGAYNKAYATMMLPLNNVVDAIREVMMPAMSEAQDDHARLQMLYVRTVQLIAFVVFPVMAGISAVAEPLIIGLYGEAWRSTVPLLEVLALVGGLQSIVSFGGTVLYAVGRPDISTKISVVSVPSVALMFYISLHMYGVQGMVFFYAGFSVIRLLLDAVILRSQIGLSVRRIWQAILPPLGLSMIMYVTVRILRSLPWYDGVHEIVVLLMCAVTGAVIYAGLALALRLEVNRELARFVPGLTKIPLIGQYLRNDD
jgi:PST family polysaccharide transporter